MIQQVWWLDWSITCSDYHDNISIWSDTVPSQFQSTLVDNLSKISLYDNIRNMYITFCYTEINLCMGQSAVLGAKAKGRLYDIHWVRLLKWWCKHTRKHMCLCVCVCGPFICDAAIPVIAAALAIHVVETTYGTAQAQHHECSRVSICSRENNR